MPDLLRSVIGRFARHQIGAITAEDLYDEFFASCSPEDPSLGSFHRLVRNYQHDWWKDRFDKLGFQLPMLNLHEVMEMVCYHFEQLPMGTMLLAGPQITGQVDGDALCNQFLAVKTHLERLGTAMAVMLEHKTQAASAAAATMAELEAPMEELLFACHVAGRHMSVLPPLALDVHTMIACRHLAMVLASAYANPIQLNFDMIRYHEALDRRSSGRIAKHEEALLQKFPNPPDQLLVKPSVLVDSGGRIILWYLPDAISPWIQASPFIFYYRPADMEEATAGMSFLLKKSMSSAQQTNWRTYAGHFHLGNQSLVGDRPPVTPGCINVAPCWFHQGREPHGLPAAGGFVPEVSATLKGVQGRWAMENSLGDIYTCLQLWASVFNCASVICNRQCPPHRDPRSAPEGFDLMTSVGNYSDGLMTLSNLGIQLRYDPGAMVACSGHIVRHGVTCIGDRIVWAWFMRDSLHNFVGTPRPEYMKYTNVDTDASASP
ncbi:hypothetical protein DEU56DRAFT_757444 [Suillus clintonianus]|uniref:uncharacterized protein n=1 Tax=Suillus clintonianus TaxID=1904413 RepID=UPI001B866C72|nr:uncharacterized protein DEU56DRAFT_757444 [Suillus clintonianus]KAG2132111.1 hypothetical protein DEU56DRAFT_757444 [Suillus clintonianus]